MQWGGKHRTILTIWGMRIWVIRAGAACWIASELGNKLAWRSLIHQFKTKSNLSWSVEIFAPQVVPSKPRFDRIILREISKSVCPSIESACRARRKAIPKTESSGKRGLFIITIECKIFTRNSFRFWHIWVNVIRFNGSMEQALSPDLNI